MCEPKIYVADLAAYNNGILHGAWMDAAVEPEALAEQISALLACSPVEGAEEFAVHDYEGFAGVSIGEYTGIARVCEIACFIEEHGELGGAILSHRCGDLEAARRAIDEDYCGCYANLAEYAQQLTEETTTIPDNIQYYIDYERMGRDMEMSGDLYTIEIALDEVHVFWNR